MNERSDMQLRIKAAAASLCLAGAVAACSSGSTSFPGSPGSAATVRQINTITGPGVPPAGSFSFDITVVDPATQLVYLSDRSNKGVDVFNGSNDTYVARLTGGNGFAGTGAGDNDNAGPDGLVLATNSAGTPLLYAGDGPNPMSSVKVFNRATNAYITTINTGGTARTDEGSFDPVDNIVMIANDADNPPYLNFINTNTNTVIGKLSFPQATNGIEASEYDSATHMFYVNIPTTTTNAGGEVDVINPTSMTIVKVFPITSICTPAGLAFGPNRNMAIACEGVSNAAGTTPPPANAETLIMNMDTGAIVATITQVGGADEMAYNPGDNRYYEAARDMTTTGAPGGPADPVLGVIDAGSNTWISNAPTATNAHSVGVDPVNNQIFVPETAQGIGVFANR